jgi:hypothetical protein
MTREELILMAKASGLDQYRRDDWGLDHEREKWWLALDVFTTLVTAAEREACAKITETAEPYQSADLIRARGQA